MQRLATFPVLFPLALGCVVGAWVVAPHGCESKAVPATSLVLIVVGGALPFGSLAVPLIRYARADGGRVSAFTLIIGIGGCLFLAGLLLLIPTILILNGGTNCGD